MLEIASNQEIASYLKKLIIDRYSSTRKFCIDYLNKASNHKLDGETATSLSNHLNDVLRGNEELDISDLPVLAELLDVSFEDILSAGKAHHLNPQHMSNYHLVFTEDQKIWEDYINREDKLFLNSDEYGKTIIDYALEYERYELLVFLLQRGYIWFTEDDPTAYYKTFKAGTSIKPRESGDVDRLDRYLAQGDNLRKTMLILALKHNDLETLKALRAREIPPLYDAANYLSTYPDFEEWYSIDLNQLIAKSSNEVLNYYSQDFEIIGDHGYKTFFIYPFIKELLTILIKEHHPYVKEMLLNVIEHNLLVYERLSTLINHAVDDMCSEEWQKDMRELNTKLAKRHIYYKPDKKIISFTYQTLESRLVTNVVDIDIKSDDPIINDLIDKLKDSYKRVINYKKA